MTRTRRIRSKPCSRCSADSDVLYRVRIEQAGDWVFVCPTCLQAVKPDNPHYLYGGTWKSRTRR